MLEPEEGYELVEEVLVGKKEETVCGTQGRRDIIDLKKIYNCGRTPMKSTQTLTLTLTSIRNQARKVKYSKVKIR